MFDCSKKSKDKMKVDTRSSAEHIANIRDVFSISMSELASVFGVTRPTAYAWLEGQEPEPETVKRIRQLSRAADEIKQANIIRLDLLVHWPILNGRSLFDMLKAISEKEDQARHEPKGSGKHLRSLRDVLDEFS